MFGWLNRLWGKGGGSGQAYGGSQNERRFEAAKTDRLNLAHWKDAKGQPINADLSLNLATLRNRSTYEAANNGMVRGVVRTHRNDVVGKYGPTLQVQSEDEDYNTRLEEGWRQWWKRPDVRGLLSGARLLRQCQAQMWTCGEYLIQIVTDPDAEGPVKARLVPIHPRRLATPAGLAGDKNVVLGIRYNDFGRPVSYCILRENQFGDYSLLSSEYDEIPAEFIIHGYEEDEPGQARGIPYLTSSLSRSADVRDYDNQVLDAARNAADLAVMMWTTDPRLSMKSPATGTFELKRRQIHALPPGYQATGITPTQPTTNYVEFRSEHHREIGRPVSMPLMTVRLDASKHNYSSARIDNQNYDSGNEVIQGDYEDQMLNRLVAIVTRELSLADDPQARLPRRPRTVNLVWIWPKRKHVDPVKEPQGEAIELENLTLTLSEALARRGTDIDSHVARLAGDIKKVNEALGELGLPMWLKTKKSTPVQPGGDQGGSGDGNGKDGEDTQND